MKTLKRFPVIMALTKVLPRCGSLLLLFQRSPIVQMLFPEARMLATFAATDSTKFVIASVVGLGVYDSVAGATTVRQVAPVAGSATVPVTSGTHLAGAFQIVGGGGHTPQSWSISSGTLPSGLTLANVKGKSTTLSGTTTQAGSHQVTIRGWETAKFSGRSASGTFTIQVSGSAAAPAGIATQPSSTTINSGATATLTVVATGAEPLTYQWFEGISGTGTTPVGTNAASFTTPVLTNNKSYWVKVSNDANPGGANSNTATITVRQPAAITTHPAPTTINIGETATLSVVASGDGPLTYQWYQGDSGDTTTPVGTNSASLTTPPLIGTTRYWVKVTNIANPNGAASAAATVTVAQPPSPVIFVLTPPSAGHVGEPYNINLTAAGGTAPYVWTLLGGALPDGLALSTDGVVSGTPTIMGTSDFTVQVEDAAGLTDTQSYTIAVTNLAVATDALPPAVKNVAFNHALTCAGGSPPYGWMVSGGGLPPGVNLSSAGVLTGIPATAGSFIFSARVTDAAGFSVSRQLSLPVSATYLMPVVQPVQFSPVTIGTTFNYAVLATNYPKSFAITGLPPGLKYSAATGVISGRPTKAGSFGVTIKAVNPAGTSSPVLATLPIAALPGNLIGTFTGICARDGAANRNLGSLLTLTTTSNGSFSAKITTGGVAKAATGFLADSLPQISVMVDGALLSLVLDSQTNLISGSHGNAAVTGWRSTWHSKLNPATGLAGYYSAAIDLADATDSGVLSIPQGSGFVTLKAATSGTVSVVGKTADGAALTASGLMGPDGQLVLHVPLYAKLGSLSGTAVVSKGATASDNAVIGTVTWLKPTTTSQTYGATFGPLNLRLYGKYLGLATNGVVLGLPATGTASLVFDGGGLDLAGMNPNVPAFSYNDKFQIVMPTAGSAGNPAKAVLSINKATGAVAGSFTLIDGSLVRPAKFTGVIVRPETGDAKAAGYFLLPQIPLTGQTIKSSPILSGTFRVLQPAP